MSTDNVRGKRRVTVVLFDGFELLDAFGPVELFSAAPEQFEIDFVGPNDRDLVPSHQGVAVAASRPYRDAGAPDIVLVPGGPGTRSLAHDDDFLAWLREYADRASLVSSVCTGSALLAAAGLLDGYRATSNKAAFRWVTAQGPEVDWVPEARWVEDRTRWTSSGVAAGMDMTAAMMRHVFGNDVAEAAAAHIELETHDDPTWDPFARRYGLA